jgi:hypothetical protein
MLKTPSKVDKNNTSLLFLHKEVYVPEFTVKLCVLQVLEKVRWLLFCNIRRVSVSYRFVSEDRERNDDNIYLNAGE